VSHRGDGRCPRQEAAGEAITRARRVHMVRHGQGPTAQTRDMVIVFAQGAYGISQMAEYSMLLGGSSKMYRQASALPEVLAKYGLTAHG
jgi:hypothetical protein